MVYLSIDRAADWCFEPLRKCAETLKSPSRPSDSGAVSPARPAIERWSCHLFGRCKTPAKTISRQLFWAQRGRNLLYGAFDLGSADVYSFEKRSAQPQRVDWSWWSKFSERSFWRFQKHKPSIQDSLYGVRLKDQDRLKNKARQNCFYGCASVQSINEVSTATGPTNLCLKFVFAGVVFRQDHLSSDWNPVCISTTLIATGPTHFLTEVDHSTGSNSFASINWISACKVLDRVCDRIKRFHFRFGLGEAKACLIR